jgi:hypothetical protein
VRQRLTYLGQCACESFNLPDAPIERSTLVAQGLHCQDLLYVPEALQSVVIDNGHKVVEMVLRRKQNCLSVGPFIQLTIPQ